MSAIEFGLAPQTPFLETPSQVLFEEHYNRAKALMIPYQELSQVSRLMGSMTHDTRLKQLIELSGSLVSTSLMVDAELGPFLTHVTKTMQRIMTLDFAVIGQSQVEDGRFQVMAFDAGDDSALTQQSIEGLAEGWSNLLSTGKGWTGKLGDLNANDAVDEGSRAELSMQGCVLPLMSRERLLGVFALGKRGDDLAVAIQNALLLAAGDADVGVHALTGPVDDAAHHRHRDGSLHAFQRLGHLRDHGDHVDLQATARRTGDQVGPVAALL